MTRKSRVAVWIAAGFGGLVLLLAVVGVGLRYYVTTDSGRAWLQARIEAAASGPGQSLSLGSIEGDPFSSFEIRDLNMADAEGDWLAVERITVNWTPFALLGGTLDVTNLAVSHVNLARLPQGQPAEDESAGGLPQLPVDVVVGDFALTDIAVAAAAMGTDAVFEAAGDLRITGDDGYDLNIAAQRVDRADGSLDARVAYDPGDATLTMDVAAHAPAGGAITGLLSMPGEPALDLAINGDGALADWQGTVRLMAGESQALGLDLTLQEQDTLAVGMDGTVDPRLFVDAPLLTTPYDLTGDLVVDGGLITISSIALEGPPAALRLFGSADLDQSRVDLLFQFQPRDLAAINALAEPVTLGPTTVDGRISGTFSNPTLSLNVIADSLEASGNQAQSLFVNLIANQEESGIALWGSGGVGQLTVGEGGPTFEPTVTFDTHIAEDFSRVNLDQVTLLVDDGRVLVNGVVPFGDGEMDLAVDADMPPRSAGQDMISALLAPGFSGSANINRVNAQAPLAISDISLQHPWVTASGYAQFGETATGALADLSVNVTDVSALAGAFDMQASGQPVSLEAQVHDNWSAPRVNAALKVPSLTVAGNAFSELAADLSMTGGGGNARTGQFTLNGTTPAGRTDFQTGFTMPEQGPIEIADLQLKSDAATLSGGFTIPQDGTPIVGSLNGQIDANEDFQEKFGVPLNGMVQLSLDLTNEVGAQSAVLTASGDDVFLGPAQINSVVASLLKTSDSMDFALDAVADYRGNTSLSLDGSYLPSGDTTSLRVRTLAATIGNWDIALHDEFRILQRDNYSEIEPVTLQVGDGSVRIAAKQQPALFDLTVDLTDLPLAALETLDLPVGIGGTLSGNIALKGQDESASGQIDLAVDGLAVTGGTARLANMNGTITGNWDGNRLQLDSNIAESGADTAFRLTAALPLVYGSSTGALSMPPDAPLSANATWSGEIAPLWQAVSTQADFLSGQVNADVQVSGTMAAPEPRGQLSLDNGSYRNVDAGTVLQDLIVRVNITPGRAVIEQMEATDGRGGTLSASGGAQFGGEALAVNIDLTFDDLQAVSRPEVTARASGDLTYEMGEGTSKISGQITTNRTEVRLVTTTTAETTTLDVREIPEPYETAETAAFQESEGPPMELDIDVSIPNQLFIRGRGLDSEWQGDINVHGTAEDFRLNGSVELIRGIFNFAGKRTVLTRGMVQFVGASPVNPQLDIRAEYDTGELTAFLGIGGTARDIDISLTSNPSYPEDEIVSHILFESGVDQLSPLQAVQLAAAMRSLSQGGGGGLVGTARSTLGLDVLTFGSGDDGHGTVVRGGKYITRNVYLEVQSGTEPGSEKVGVQVQVTDNLSVETDIKQDTGGDIGFYWRRDY